MVVWTEFLSDKLLENKTFCPQCGKNSTCKKESSWKKPYLCNVKETLKRHISSWALLAVFLPMLLVASLHVHPTEHVEAGHCEQCMHHVPHSGHYSTLATACFSDCLLCQFLSLPFLEASAVVLSTLTPSFIFPFHTKNQHVVFGTKGVISLRAPPRWTTEM